MMGAGSDEPRADDSLRSLIRMARDDFDEEPSPRIDALLMAAARKHAPEPRPGVLARLRRWLGVSMLSPAVAGATALVVIGGTAGVLYLRDPRRVAEPTVGGVASTGEPAHLEEKAPEAKGAAPPEAAAPLGAAAEPAAGDPATPEPARTVRSPRRDRVAPAGGAAGAEGAADGDDLGFTAGVATDMRTTESPPPPPPPREPVVTLSDTETALPSPRGAAADATTQIAGAGTERRDQDAERRTQAENLLRQARTAAKQKQCAAVKVMAERARKLDAAYYASTFAADADVKTCL